MAEIIKSDNYYMFKGKPLVREGNTICYGSMSDKCVLYLIILSEKTIKTDAGNEYSVPDKIMVQVYSTDNTKSDQDRVIKNGVKNGLYDAMEIGCVWLKAANK